VIRALVFALLLAATPAAAQDKPPRVGNGLALTPPMGWNSWNKFQCNVDEGLIRRTADSIVASGMRDAGYLYVVIDDCWHGARDAHGDIQPDPARFPSGMKALGDYIHGLGLKFGIYSDAGDKTCGGRPGSQGREYQDAAQYAAWGVDYLKYDWCSTGTRDAQEAYTLMSDALRATGRAIVLSMCEWGNHKPWLWARNVGNSWRTTGDIFDKWEGSDPGHAWAHSLVDILDQNAELYPYSGPGGWNDADMLEVGNGGMSDDEYRAHFAMWAMLASPLMAGNDIATMTAATRTILTNAEVIAIDQDPLGQQARRVAKHGDVEVWARPLADGGRAVALLNRGKDAASISVDWTAIGYPAKLKARIRDLWEHKDLPPATGRFEANVRSHAALIVKVMP
jgi:alpha-galactosidase